ncbi:hypothetical protein CQA4T8M7_16950 [Sphaerotilus natans]|nr:hypothetical protein CQA4T8M7_16950 [Sphaerotilus natans]
MPLEKGLQRTGGRITQTRLGIVEARCGVAIRRDDVPETLAGEGAGELAHGGLVHSLSVNAAN